MLLSDRACLECVAHGFTFLHYAVQEDFQAAVEYAKMVRDHPDATNEDKLDPSGSQQPPLHCASAPIVSHHPQPVQLMALRVRCLLLKLQVIVLAAACVACSFVSTLKYKLV
jgi:hypothetical protein